LKPLRCRGRRSRAACRGRCQADGDGDADLTLYVAGKAGEHDCGGCAVQRLGAGEVEHGLVDG